MSVLSLPDAKVHLNIASETHDGELVRMIDAAEAAIAKRVGPLEPTAVTERVKGCRRELSLTRLPVVTLASVTPVAGTALTVGDLRVDTEAGLVSYEDGRFGFGARLYDVEYFTGRATCPPDLMMAVKELVRHMWDTQRGGARRPGSPQSDALSNTLPGSAYTFPIRVSELLAPYELAILMGGL